MFNQDATTPRLKEIEFDPTDAIYHLYRKSQNPFVKRAMAPPALKLERPAEALSRLFRFFERRKQYAVEPVNTEVPYTRRSLNHPPPPASSTPRYVGPENLSGNLRSLPWMVDLFFNALRQRLRNDPASFKAAVEELLAQLREDGIQVKFYRAYANFQDWNDLMDTLDEISRYPSPETFDLFCSALAAYYQLAFPDDTA